MNVITKIAEAALIKRGFSGVSVNVKSDLCKHPLTQLDIDVVIPTRCLLPAFERFLRTHSCSSVTAAQHPVGKYLLAAKDIKAGPVNLGFLCFPIRIAAGNIRVVHPRPDVLHFGRNREKIEYVYYRSGNEVKDLILGMTEHGNSFIDELYEQLQKALACQLALINAVIDKMHRSSKPEKIYEFGCEGRMLDIHIMATEVSFSIADEILSSEWAIDSVSSADKYLNYLNRYLSGRILKRHIYAVCKSRVEAEQVPFAGLPRFTSTLVMTEYKMKDARAPGIYRKAVNHALNYLTSISHENVDERQVM
ncbi:MAG: hypothetical protein E6733_01255 [Streptococcus parasanguinis]|nr:hypothetical protein [Streptococcus parasanguinis]